MEKSLFKVQWNRDLAAQYLGAVPLQSLFQRIPGLVCLTFLPFCFLGPLYTPFLFAFYYLFLHASFLQNVVRTAYGARLAYTRSCAFSKVDWRDRYCMEANVQSTSDMRHDLPYDCVRHVIIIPQYKEDLGTMYDTLDVLASHPMALTHYKICLAMEEGEKEAPAKARGLIEKYHDQFYDITSTLHPSGRPGEIRGKSSNVGWAAREMVRQSDGPRVEDIITVMDADTCFASDYFSSLSYHYAVASVRDRALMYFAPTTVFDRNADKVPFLVRLADMQWSLGVISNIYEGSSFSPPCSAYSIPARLAAAVGLWDVDPNSIGEDFHMYIKTFFSTHGQVKVVPIYSPASCCNVQGDGFVDGIMVRSVQAKRHLWGALDLGYTLRRALFGLFAPGWDAPDNKVQRIQFMNEHSKYDFGRLLAQLVPFTFRFLECHLFVGQILILLIICNNTLPVVGKANYFWNFIAGEGAVLDPYVVFAVRTGEIMASAGGLFYVLGVYYYESYQYWVGVKRWDLSYREQFNPGTGEKVKPLGIRSKLQAQRGLVNILEWFFIPLVGLLFMALPQLHVQISQLFTSNLSYVVAAKPQHEMEEVVRTAAVTSVSSISQPMIERPLPSRMTVAGTTPPSEERLEVRVIRDRDSGFFDFSGGKSVAGSVGSNNGFSMGEKQGMARMMASSPSQESVRTMSTLA